MSSGVPQIYDVKLDAWRRMSDRDARLFAELSLAYGQVRDAAREAPSSSLASQLEGIHRALMERVGRLT